MATTTSTGTATSFTNTPQAKDDNYQFSEDSLTQSGIYDNTTGNISLNVMSNDLGGGAKTLFSIDDGDGNPLTSDFELLIKDTLTTGVSAWEKTDGGNWIRINNGTIDFALGAAGDISGPSGISVNSLAANYTLSDAFVMSIRLGNGAISQANVSIGITGNNDGATITATATSDYTLTEAGGVGNGIAGDPSAGGKLTVADLDAGQNVFQSVDAASLVGSYGSFSFDSGTGIWNYTLNNTNPAVEALNTNSLPLTDSLIVNSLDGTASYTITVNINGTNDAAIVSNAVEDLVETDAVLTASGTLTSDDVDNPDNAFTANAITGLIGDFSIDASGAWTFTANSVFNELNSNDSVTETFNVTSIDGTPSAVTIKITGTNDAAIVSSAVEDLVETDTVLTASGTLTSDDVDNSDNAFTASAIKGLIGDFSIDAAGAWSFTANSAFNELNTDDAVTETFDVTSIDGTPSTVKITITGTNDAAIVSSAIVDLIETDAALTASGTLTSDDVDNPDNTFTANAITGLIGDFSIDAAGAWSFTANSAFNELNTDDSVTETFDVTSIDGTPSTVKITITGTNDAATVSSAVENLIETDAVLTASGTLTSDDVDNPDNTFTANAITGSIGDFSIDAAGAWSFTANSVFNELNTNDSVTETFNVTSIDGTPSTVTIKITGTNDVATVSSAVENLIETDAVLTASGTLTSDDVDNPDNTFTANAITGSIGDFNIDAAGAWSFTANNTFDELNTNDSVAETFDVTSVDGTASTVEITITGTNDAAELSNAVVDLDETNAALTTGGTLTNSDVDNDDTFIAQTDTAGANGAFSISEAGAWNYTANSAFDSLNVGASVNDTFAVFAVDGTATSVQVTINGTNDAAELSNAVVSLNETNAALTTGGMLTNSDVDNDDTFAAQSGTAGNNGMFSISEAGAWTYTANSAFDSLNVGESVSDTFSVAAADGTLTSVKVTIEGTNDAAELSNAVVSLNETNAALTTGGTLTNSDVDNADTFAAQSGTAGNNGTFSISETGAWTYTANSAFNSLNVGESVSDTFSVAAVDGTLTSVKVTINGTNDIPVISGETSGDHAVKEESDLSASGTLGITDADAGQSEFTPGAGSTTYGNYTLGSNGAWSYTLNNTDTTVQALGEGVQISDSFVAVSEDGTTNKTVTIIITGTNDVPVISGETTGDRAVKEESDLGASGTLSIGDTDAGQSEFTAGAGSTTYGNYTLDSNGVWGYTLNNANTTVQALAEGAQISDSFVAVSEDGTGSKTVTIVITGTADGPVAAPAIYNGADPNDKDLVGPGAGTTVGGTANNSPNTLVGTNNADTISAQQGNDTVYGYGGNDTLNGDNDTDTIYGGAGTDTIDGGNATDFIYGGSGNDTITGGQGSDTIYGGSGNDSIQGNPQDDLIIGGYGGDTLNGNSGSDSFTYLDIRDTGDTISGFTSAEGDKIDLSAVYGGTLGYGGNTTTLAANSVIWFQTGGETVIQVETDSNIATAEMEIHLTGLVTLAAGDFIF